MSASSPAQSDQMTAVTAEQDHGSENGSGSGMNGSASGPKKRRRATIACRDCRLRKTKCDHIVSAPATDEMLRGMSKTAQVYIRSLERRLRNFEDRHRDLPRLPEYPSPTGTMATPAQVGLPIIGAAAGTQAPAPGAGAGVGAANHAQFAAPPPGPPRHTIISTSPEIFMGGKAGESFTQLILNAMNRGSAKLETHQFSSPRDHMSELSDANVLAPPPNAREMIRVYFDFHHVLSPIFHAPSILSKFEQVLTCDPAQLHEHVYTLSIMNMVCAIAAAHNRLGLEGSDFVARRYYDTAMRLVGPTLLSDWAIEKVQILLLGTRFLQSSSYPDECWNVLGLAVRIAYGLDLHRPPPESLDCISKEVRKRVWYACFGLDQLLSMIYGRPAITSAGSFTTPLPEDLDDDCIQPSRLLYPSVRTTSAMSFFLQVSKLYSLLESAASLSEPVLEILVRLDEAFEQWYADVPEGLKIREGTRIEDDKTLILALRSNMVRILIHRQSLVPALSALSTKEEPPGPSGRLRVSMLQRSRQICVSTAEETIQLVSQRHEQTKSAMGPSWFNLYYLFNAILIIVSHVVDPEFQGDRPALMHLEQAMHMIRQMSANHLCAQRAYTFLQQLLGLLDKTLPEDRQRILSRVERSNTPPAQPMGNGEPPPANGSHPPDELMVPDLWSFWGTTQDLTTDLASQLEMHSTMGSGAWSWDAAQYSAEPDVMASPYRRPP